MKYLVIILFIGFTIGSLSFIKENTYTKNALMGKINPSTNSDFVKVNSTYATRAGLYLRKDAYLSFVKMYNAAKQDGVELKIISAFRSFYHQKSIWEAKWTGRRLVEGENLSKLNFTDNEKANKILLYSSMPGSSRHHWGTDIDLNSLDNKYFEVGIGVVVYSWLRHHAKEYGYCQVYTSGRKVGYEQEKWHWSYLPIAKPMLKAYQEQIKVSDFSGFLGYQQADSVGIIKNYVMGINKECKY